MTITRTAPRPAKRADRQIALEVRSSCLLGSKDTTVGEYTHGSFDVEVLETPIGMGKKGQAGHSLPRWSDRPSYGWRRPGEPRRGDRVEADRKRTSPRLDPMIGESIPDAEHICLVMLDGLGSLSSHHEDGAIAARIASGTLHAPFPSTTSVSLATVATGLPPLSSWADLASCMDRGDRRRGEHAEVGGCGRSAGRTMTTAAVPPGPNLWERLGRRVSSRSRSSPGHSRAAPCPGLSIAAPASSGRGTTTTSQRRRCNSPASPNRLIFTYVVAGRLRRARARARIGGVRRGPPAGEQSLGGDCLEGAARRHHPRDCRPRPP